MNAQSCTCTNCPEDIPISSTTTLDFEVSGAMNNDLADAGQGVCGVYISFEHDFIWNIEMVLTSPGGQMVTLVGADVMPPFGSFTGFANWAVTFEQCSEVVVPDAGFSPTWSNNQSWLAAGIYTGSYYPNSGCLEDFNTGVVDGTWTLTTTNTHPFYTGEVLDFEIIFCDTTGMGCFTCGADGGELVSYDTITLCQEDPMLELNIPPVYTTTEPDTNSYGYYYVITQNDLILDYDTIADLQNYEGGEYKICGLSYLYDDSLSIPNPNGLLTYTDLVGGLNNTPPDYCGDLSDTCIVVNILSTGNTIIDTICDGETYFYEGNPLTTTGEYDFVFPSTIGCTDSTVVVNLTVLDTVLINLTAVICAGESFIVGDSIYTISGSYSNVFTAFNTCDSTVNLNLMVSDLLETNLSEQICEGEGYQVGDSIYTETGMYSDTLVAINTCDSIVNLNLTVNQPSINNIITTICEGESFEVGDSVYTISGMYNDTLVAFNTCDSIINLDLTVNPPSISNINIAICEGESFEVGDSIYTIGGIYNDTLVAFNTCDSIVNLNLTVNPSSINNIVATICTGESFTVGDSVYAISGLYNDTLVAFNTCDSIVNLNLTVSDFYETNLSEEICEGESVLVGDSIYTVTGMYSDTLVAINTCDSIVNLNLTVNQPSINNIITTICEGESLEVGDSVYTISGMYNDTLVAFNTCDSIINLDLTVNPPSISNINIAICEGESFEVGDSIYTIGGIYNDTLVAFNTCDSIVNLNLTVNPSSINNIVAIICTGESFSIGDSVYTISGMYNDTLVAFNTCDSIVNLNLTVSDFYETNLSEEICEGESVLVGDSIYTVTGMYSDTLVAINTCDSIVNLNLTVNQPSINNIITTICEGESFEVGDSVYTISGMYNDTLVAFNTCDSIINLDLTVNPPSISNINIAICEGESFEVGDSIYTLGGIYNDTLVAFNTCDSIVNLNLTVNPFSINNIVATICTGESFSVGDSVYTISGMYNDTLVAFNTCDSIINLNLTVSDFYETNLSEEICEGESYQVGDSIYTETGMYSDTLLALNGCDSIVNLTLTVNAFSINNITTTICEGESFSVGDSVYTISGMYNDTLVAFNTCDSIINLNLTVSDFYETNLSEEICEGESYQVGDSIYTETGMYSDTLLALNGCDSIVNLTLTVNAFSINNITTTICEGESFSVGDSVYTISGMYNDTLVAFNTCDSIVNLNLTVSDFYETNLSEQICEGESVLVGDSIYTVSGIYSDTLLALNSCDSIVNLTLTVNAPSITNIVATICTGESFSVGDSVYTISGMYNDTLVAFNTCDSIINLNLTVSDFYETNLSEEICEGESYQVGDSIYTMTGMYSDTLLALNACDSIVNLTLTVNAPSITNIVATICTGESYSVGDSVYTISGMYNDTLVAFNTCDSIINLNLTVSDFYETNLSEEICEGESYQVGDSIYTMTGMYSDTLLALNACDSIVNLTLTVNAPSINNIVATICTGESFSVGDSVYTISGMYSDTLVAFNTCDSIINLNLTVSDFYETNLSEEICEGESYQVGDSIYTETGMYSDTLLALNGCDSIVNLTLTVNAFSINNITTTICEGESFSVGDSVYTISGMYNDTLVAFNTCDSIINLNLTVSDFYETNLSEEICEGESYQVGDSIYTMTGMYSDTLLALNSCDSIVNLTLTVNAPSITNIVATICTGESFSVGDSVYTISGMYSDTLVAFNTCDSIVNLNLTVSDFYETNLSEEICEGESYQVGDSIYTETGMYSDTLLALNGCDSIVNLTLTVNAFSINNIVATICTGESFSVGDSVYTISGMYSDTLVAFNTCDSIVNLNLTVSDFYETNLSEEICEGESYQVGDSIYTMTGMYSDTLLALNACDSIVNLTLTVNAPSITNIVATVCTGESFSVGDSVYTISGMYSDTLVAFNTCDSIVNLNLTVSDFYETNLSEEICEGESYQVGDSIYTMTGMYSDTLLALNACDSIVNLTLTVNAPSITNIVATICTGESFSVGDSVYTISGMYNDTLVAFNTCDSIINLNLTVSDFYETNLSEEICEGESYQVGDSIYTMTGMYSDTLSALNGCDSIVNLTLTVNASSINNIVATICTGESFSVGDSVYTISGMYNDTLVAFNTCDSIVNLNLTVSDFYETNLSEEICEGESYQVGDSIYTLTGNYSDTLLAFNTCDSIVNLDLLVIDFFETNLTEVICEGESFTVGGSTYTETGIYNDSLFSLSGCDSIVTLDLTVLNPIVSIMLPDNLDCLVEELSLLAIVNVSLSGSTIEVSWSHLGNGGDGIIGAPSALSVLVNKSGLYQISVIETLGGGTCTTTETVLVQEEDNDIENVLTESEDPTCFGETDGWIAVTAVEGGTLPLSYRLNEEIATELPAIWRGLDEGTYDLVVEDANGCQWDTTFTLISPNSVIVFLPEDQSIQLGDSVVFEAQVNLPLDQIDTLLWSPANLLNCDTCYEQQYTPLETVQFTAKVIDENGCESSDDILIEVIKDRLVFIPNAFSPNGDGKNDLFMIYSGAGVAEVNSFQIYDRYGAQVYKATNFQPNDPAYSWDGYHMGKPLNPAVFAFFAEIRFIDGLTLLYKGDVTIIK